MKLAQALIERADLQRKLAQLGARLQQNAHTTNQGGTIRPNYPHT